MDEFLKDRDMSDRTGEKTPPDSQCQLCGFWYSLDKLEPIDGLFACPECRGEEN